MRNQSVNKKPRRGRARIGALIAIGSIVAIVVLAILVDAALYYNKVHAGVKVSTVSLGGYTQEEAKAALNRYVQNAQKSAIVLTSGDRTWPIMPDDVGTQIDASGAVSQAMDVSRESNFFGDLVKRFKLYFSEVEIPLRGTVDSTMMDKVLGDLAHELDVTPVNAGLAIDGAKIKVIESKNGRAVDRDTLREELKALLLTPHTTEMEIPIVVQEPEVQAEDNRTALEQAEIMLSGPLRLTSGENTWTLIPEDIAVYMGFDSEERDGVSTLVPYFSAEKNGHVVRRDRRRGGDRTGQCDLQE